MVWESSMRFPQQLPLPGHRGLPPDPFESNNHTDAQHDGVHHRQPGQQHLLPARIQVQTRAHPQAHDSVNYGDRRGPGETEPMGREDHGKHCQGGIVPQEDEAPEPAADDDAAGDQDNFHGAEQEHPAPGHRPVRQEPEVHQAVERPQHHRKPAGNSMSPGYQKPGR